MGGLNTEPPHVFPPQHVSLTFALRTLLIVMLALANGSLFILYEQHAFHQRPSSVAHLRFGFASDRVQVRMAMGVQPGPVKCPVGMYRPPIGGGKSRGECRFCPRGVYGDSPGLGSSDCTAKCPKGTYQDTIGATSIVDCKPCPAGVYGSSPGLTSSACTAPCPLGKYSMKIGLQAQSECDDCAPNYRGPQGRRGNNPYFGYEGGYPCDRYIDGKNILNGRSANNDARLNAFYASTRMPHNEIVDNT